MGEAYSGHELLNHLGDKIRVTARTIKALSRRNYLRRDHPSGLLQINPRLYPTFLALENSDHRKPFMRELGADCSGPRVAVCHCKSCQSRESDLDHTRLSTEHHRQQVKAVLKDIKARRNALRS